MLSTHKGNNCPYSEKCICSLSSSSLVQQHLPKPMPSHIKSMACQWQDETLPTCLCAHRGTSRHSSYILISKLASRLQRARLHGTQVTQGWLFSVGLHPPFPKEVWTFQSFCSVHTCMLLLPAGDAYGPSMFLVQSLKQTKRLSSKDTSFPSL